MISYIEKSAYLKREINVLLFNAGNKNSVSFKKAKVSVGGNYFIGIQQDNFTIQLHNINYAFVAGLLAKGFRHIIVQIEHFDINGKLVIERVFSGEIRVINMGRSSAVEREIEFVCLKRVSDLMANMVVPLTMHSSANGWAIWDAFEELQNNIYLYYNGQNIAFDSEIKNILQNIYIPNQAYSVQKSPINIVEDLVGFANNYLPINSGVEWLDFKLDTNGDEKGIINLFSSRHNGIEILSIGPNTGLLDAPTISDTGLSFNHVYNSKLVPGRIIKLDNSLVTTMGGNTAFIWGWDPNGQYVITEVRCSLTNYPNRFTISCKARPYSKYQNFAASANNYNGDIV